MKKIYLLVLFVFGFSAFAQQKGISYQAVIINPKAVAAPGFNGTSIPLANKSICLSFQIVNSANQVEYQESQSITTDAYGMVNVVIGTGTSGSGLVANLDSVNWNQGNKKLIVGVNTDGVCSNYTEISNQVLNYTPYSFYAQNADIKDGYVTTAKLADGAVTDAKVAMGINPAKVGLGNVNNTSDANKPVSTATQTALNLKANTTDVTTSLALKEDVSNKSNASLGSSTTLYPTQNAVKTYVDSQISSATIVDADATTKGKIKLAGDLAGTADLPTVPGLALKADTSSLSPVAISGNYNDLTNKPSIPSSFALPTATASVLGGVKVGANLSIDANGVLNATAGNNVSSLTGVLPIANGGTGTTSIAGIKSVLGFNSSKVAIGDQAGQTNQADGSVGVGGGAGANNQGGSAVAIGYVAGYNNQGASSVAIGPNAAQSGQGSSAVAIGFAAGQNGQGANSVAIGSFAGISQVANSIAINATGISTPLNPTNAGFYVAPIRNAAESNSLFYNTTTKEITYGTAAPSGPLNLATGGTGILPIVNGGTGASNAVSALTSLGAAPIASPTFTGAVTAPIYASTPQALTAGTTINWNPINGLNASVTLDQNSTLSFTATPTAGSYGTLVVTQDATGGRTLTLPSTTNKVLGSTSTTTIALSTAANAKDILNFYYDGTNCYWNIGQGYGTAATAATTNLTTSVSGTLPVANGGTGAATLTGLVKGNGTGAMTAAIVGTDYLAPNGSAANLTNFPTLNQNTTGNAATAITATSATNVTGTVAVANGGTGATTKTTAFDALSPMTTAGDIIYGGTSGTGSRLAKGTDGQVLQLLNGIPAWQDGLNKNTERVAFGAQAGMTNQGIFTTAVGPYSGILNQGDNATALGRNAGNSNQGGGAVAIGLAAAEFNQGANAIAIGSSAGKTAQHANSIVLNATGATLNTAIANSLYVAPIRDETAIGNILVYNTTSKEITFAPNFAGGRITAKGGSTYNDFVGFSFNGGDWAKNTGMFNDAPDDGSSPLKFRIKGISSLEVSPSKVSVLPTTASTSKTTGALTVAGGLGVTGDVFATNLNASGTVTAGAVTYPNTHGTANQVLTTTGSGTLSWSTPGGSSTHTIGESYGGGIVFYTWDNGAHGLIGANTELNSGQAMRWGGGSGTYVGTTSFNGVLGGKLNTQRILNVIPVPTYGNGDPQTGQRAAAFYAATYLNAPVVVNGVTITPQFSDWYLPNAYELTLFATQSALFPNCNFATHDHWTSSERSDYAYLAYALGANSNSYIYQTDKSSTNYVVAIRSF